uniref:Fibronectin type III and SPRY domain containing 1 n=1 Tax=Terrapene triunguis TaxID=2587831 RepID=A0A674KCE2_9SAUR
MAGVGVLAQDALRKIITTLAVKNEEIQNFIYGLKQMLQNVEANSTKVQEDLEGEFQSLYSLLDELKEGMLMKIKQDRALSLPLQNQLAACTKALESSEERLETANQTLRLFLGIPTPFLNFTKLFASVISSGSEVRRLTLRWII